LIYDTGAIKLFIQIQVERPEIPTDFY
jgi:hypothetical protein